MRTLFLSVHLYKCKSGSLKVGHRISCTDRVTNEKGAQKSESWLQRRVDYRKEEEAEDVWPGNQIAKPLQDHSIRNSTRRKEKKTSKKGIGQTISSNGSAKVLPRTRCWSTTGPSGGFLLSKPPCSLLYDPGGL